MQNRRLLYDDGRGLGEALNETDARGRGIEVNAHYFIQIFDTRTTESLQRLTQLTIDEPIQYFFATSFDVEEDQKEKCISCISDSNLMTGMNDQIDHFNGELKI